MRISDWSSDVCSSDLVIVRRIAGHADRAEKLAASVADEAAARRRDASVRENVRKRADECRASLSHSGKGAAADAQPDAARCLRHCDLGAVDRGSRVADPAVNMRAGIETGGAKRRGAPTGAL